MIRTREWIAFFLGVLIALAVTTFVIQRTNTVQHRLCESNARVRGPLLDYISSTIPLYQASQRIQRAEAKLAPKPTPELAALQRQLAALQTNNFHQLLDLNTALRAANVSGCPAT